MDLPAEDSPPNPRTLPMPQLTLEDSPVLRALKGNAVPALRRLEVAEDDAVVELTGTVHSYYLKQLAQEAVRPLIGGRRLLNHIEVVRE
jgi:hypothetical protein